MYPRIEGEVAKLVQVENGWNVVVWDPEAPKPAAPGQAPCAQQPAKFWKTYIFQNVHHAIAFLDEFLKTPA